MADLSIHPGRAKYGRNYDPSRRADGEPITKTAKDRTKGKLGKKVRRLEARIKERALGVGNKPDLVNAYTIPGSMK